MCMLPFTAQYPKQNWTRNCSALKIIDFKNFCMILKKGERMSYESRLQKQNLL